MSCSDTVPIYYVAGTWMFIVWLVSWLFGGNGGIEFKRMQISHYGFYMGLAGTFYYAGTRDFLCFTTQALSPIKEWNIARNFIFLAIQLCFVTLLTKRFNKQSQSTVLNAVSTLVAHIFLGASVYFDKETNYLFLLSWSTQLAAYWCIFKQNWQLPPSDTNFTKQAYFVGLIYWNFVYIILFIGPWITNHSSLLVQELLIAILDCILAAPLGFKLIRYSWVSACDNDNPITEGDVENLSQSELARLRVEIHTKDFYKK